MKIKALLLAVTRLESKQVEKTTKSGIIIPIGIATVSNVPLKGRVEHIGPGLKDVPMEVKVGDVVLYKRDSIITEVDGMDLLEQGMLIQIESEEEEFDAKSYEVGVMVDAWNSKGKIVFTEEEKRRAKQYPLDVDECFKSESEE